MQGKILQKWYQMSVGHLNDQRKLEKLQVKQHQTFHTNSTPSARPTLHVTFFDKTVDIDFEVD